MYMYMGRYKFHQRPVKFACMWSHNRKVALQMVTRKSKEDKSFCLIQIIYTCTCMYMYAMHCIISEHINTRHWIADSWPGICSYMCICTQCIYVCMYMYAYHYFGMQLTLHTCTMASLYLCVCVYMHCS